MNDRFERIILSETCWMSLCFCLLCILERIIVLNSYFNENNSTLTYDKWLISHPKNNLYWILKIIEIRYSIANNQLIISFLSYKLVLLWIEKKNHCITQRCHDMNTSCVFNERVYPAKQNVRYPNEIEFTHWRKNTVCTVYTLVLPFTLYF